MNLHCFKKYYNPIFIVSGIIGFTIIMYHRLLTLDFVLDDYGFLYWIQTLNTERLSEIGLLWIHNPIYYRPFPFLFWWLDYHLWGGNPFGFHFTNIFIHVINAFFVFLLARDLVSYKAGLMATFFFLLHPITIEPVAWICCRQT